MPKRSEGNDYSLWYFRAESYKFKTDERNENRNNEDWSHGCGAVSDLLDYYSVSHGPRAFIPSSILYYQREPK